MLDGYPVTVEFYQSVIKVKDEANNIINIDKNKDNFRFELFGKFTFEKAKRNRR